MNINKISNEKATNVKNHAMCAVFGHETEGFCVNMGFVTEVQGELFHFLKPTPSQSEEVIKTIMQHGIKLNTEEYTMINSFINKTGDRLVYSVTGYDFPKLNKRGVSMVVVSRGGVAAVFCFGYGVFFNKTRETFYVDKIPSGNYLRYTLEVSELYETHVVLVDTKRGSFEINQGYGKSVYDYYRVGEKIPAVLALHDGHVKAREEEKEKQRQFKADCYQRMMNANSKYISAKNKIKKTQNREMAIEMYNGLFELFMTVEKRRDEYEIIEPSYVTRRKPAQFPNFNELFTPESHAEIKEKPVLRLVA
ncbi:hypothetical protein C2K73_09075 [Salmonella enterica]|nr:hypothetical protein [Salmonella enterica]EDE4835541.1 hypothetical protein [Salmonella enterica subsp. enterica serovar Newport]ECX8623719.1 hypothetical protein [Salmonella enterica]EDO5603380.1 hypothetical protein [Salmonella enterica]EDY2875102.1 hypothetical protein [Salmonella enterica]